MVKCFRDALNIILLVSSVGTLAALAATLFSPKINIHNLLSLSKSCWWNGLALIAQISDEKLGGLQGRHYIPLREKRLGYYIPLKQRLSLECKGMHL